MFRVLFNPRSQTESAPQEEKDAFKFKRYVIVTRAYTDAPPDAEEAGGGDKAEPGSSDQPASKKAKRKKVRVVFVRHHALLQ